MNSSISRSRFSITYSQISAAGARDASINKELAAEIDVLAAKTQAQKTIKEINAIMEARTNLGHNAAPLLTVEALLCVLGR